MRMAERIEQKLRAELAPQELSVTDDSAKHHGHAGWREGGETHFRVRIATRQFAGKTRLMQHRAVMDALDVELKAGVHALAIEVLPPDGPMNLPNHIG